MRNQRLLFPGPGQPCIGSHGLVSLFLYWSMLSRSILNPKPGKLQAKRGDNINTFIWKRAYSGSTLEVRGQTDKYIYIKKVAIKEIRLMALMTSH